MSAFTLKRDAYQRERREKALEPLREQYAGLRAKIAKMRRKLTGDKHHDAFIESDLKPICFAAQDVWAELSVIEVDLHVKRTPPF